MERIEADILIAGGGIAGLLASAVLAGAGFSTLCADPVPPVTDEGAAGADLRSTAFLMPAVALLDRAGLWPRLAPHAAPLRIMRIVDVGGAEGQAPVVADFIADDINQPAFAYNLPNWLIRREVLAHLAGMDNARLLAPARVGQMVARSSGAIVALDGGRQVRAALVIAADGRNSPLREAAGIAVRQWSYGQKALVFTVRHAAAHDNISTEVHRAGGPFTLVPLPDPHQSAVVWMDTGPDIARLAALDDAAFSAEATARSADVLGELHLQGRRATWPIIAQQAARLDAPRLALMAEAAHVIPPIGAQGLNMSLADLACLSGLLQAARAAGQDIGAPGLLARYSFARLPDMAARIAGVDLLNRASIAQMPGVEGLRRQGLRLLHGAAPLRRAAMLAGLGRSLPGQAGRG